MSDALEFAEQSVGIELPRSVIEALKDEHPLVRVRAIEVLSALGPDRFMKVDRIAYRCQRRVIPLTE